MANLRVMEAMAAVVGGQHLSWTDFNVSPHEFLQACAHHEVTSLMYHALVRGEADWPAEVQSEITGLARFEEATELVRQTEIRRVLDALGENRISPILLKGTPLAYSAYDTPACRPRLDTDLVLRRADVEVTRRVMAQIGYDASVQCDGELASCQFTFERTDDFGVCHAFDFHWKISTQPVFADVLSYDDLAAGAMPFPQLGVHAIAVGWVHALLLACLHPIMHHRNDERLLWIFDIHLIASRMNAAEWETFALLAMQKKVAAISAHQLGLARKTFKTAIPASLEPRLASVKCEPSAEYLLPGRRWHHELISSVHGLPSAGERLRLLREVLFPSPRYMLRAYGIAGKPLAPLLLPVLYLYRNVYGVMKIARGKK